MNIQGLKTGEMTGTDAEACAYLYTASLEAPISRDWTNIYFYIFYIAGKVYEKWRTPDSKVTILENINVEKLSDCKMGQLNHLKQWLYKWRVDELIARDRAWRREDREAAE